jgi:ribose 5-phosphate isomerase B
MAANKVAGVRAATVHDATSARLSREHNDANVICLGERLVGPQVALDAVDAWLDARFEGGRHAERVAKLDALIPADEPA